MKLDRELSFLKDVPKNDRKLISGGATVASSFSGKYSSSGSLSSSSFVYSRDGVSSGGGQISHTVTIDGVVVKSDRKSFKIGPTNGPINFRIESSVGD